MLLTKSDRSGNLQDRGRGLRRISELREPEGASVGATMQSVGVSVKGGPCSYAIANGLKLGYVEAGEIELSFRPGLRVLCIEKRLR